MSLTNPAFCERVVYAGLRRMTNDRRVVADGFQYWQDKLASQPFDIPGVVAQIESYLHLDTSEKKRFMIAMHAASSKLMDDLEPLPGYLSSAPARVKAADGDDEDQPKIVKSTPPLVSACTEYCIDFAKRFARLAPGDADEFAQACREDFSVSNNSVQMAIAESAGSRFTTLALPHDLSESDGQELVSALYSLAVEFANPMDVDKLQYKTVEALLEMDFARRFDPRKLI